jgi:hypothetical protein
MPEIEILSGNRTSTNSYSGRWQWSLGMRHGKFAGRKTVCGGGALGLMALLAFVLSCQPRAQFASIELGEGISFASPLIRIQLETGEILSAPWRPVSNDDWVAELGGHLSADMRLTQARGDHRVWEFRVRLRNGSDSSVAFRTVYPLVVNEASGGFFDFSTGEPPRWLFLSPERSSWFTLEPDSAVSATADGAVAFQPISGVLCYMRWQDGERGAFHVRRQSKTKRRYDLEMGRAGGQAQLVPGGEMAATIAVEVMTGKTARAFWEARAGQRRSSASHE